MAGDRGGEGSHGADLERSGWRRGGRSALLETSWPAALLIEDGSWGKKGRRSRFPPGPTLYRTGSTTGSSGQGPEVPVDRNFRVRLTGSSADARKTISGLEDNKEELVQGIERA